MKKNFILLALFLCIFLVSQDVNAAGYIAGSAPNTFVTNKAGRNYVGGKLTDTANDAVMANPSMASNATGRGNNIIDYHTSTGDKIFCVDRMTDYAPNSTYTKSGETVDNGIVYIITHAENYYNSNFASKGPNPNLEASWFTQVAIWKYQNANNFTSISMTQKEIIEEGISVDSTTFYTYSENALKLWALADKLVEQARGALSDSSSTVSDLIFNYDGGHIVDKDNKIIKTNLISVQNSSAYTSFGLDLSKAPAGTKVYTESGEEITATINNIKADTKFYLTFPIDNLDNYTYNFNISANTSTNSYKGYKYTNGANQPVVLVTNEEKPIMAALKLEGSHIEDTASSASKIMYIGGLFILICGVLIIYANVKPRKQQI